MFKHVLITAAATAAAATALMAAPALANPNTASVSYADLDLRTEAGRATLEARLNAAVRNVCGGRAPIRNLAAMAQYRQCTRTARASYAEQVRLALDTAEDRRVAVLADRLAVIAVVRGF